MILAPSSPSVEVLRAQGFARANTLQQFELNPELQRAVKGQVLWVDEGDKETLCLYWLLGTVVITGPKVLDSYSGFCAHRATCLKADGKASKS
jgi:hypothetical protein